MSQSGRQNAVGKYNILLMIKLREQGKVNHFYSATILVLPAQGFGFHSEITSVKIHLVAGDVLSVIVVSSTEPVKNYSQRR